MTKSKNEHESDAERLPSQIIGNIGLFHVCCELSKRGLNVVPTSRNTRAVDVIVGNADFSRHATVQVKTSTIDMGQWIVKFEKGMERALQKVRTADLWIFVRLESRTDPQVRAITVCDSRDSDMLESSKTYWWYNPWTSKAGSAARAKWQRQTDESGWQFIVDCLSAHRRIYDAPQKTRGHRRNPRTTQ
ncbi:MAG: hypothetical protein OD918_06015 [Gammaproteobacteria bacterium]